MKIAKLKILALILCICLISTSCNTDKKTSVEEPIIPESHTILVKYILPDNIYRNKDELFFSFFSSFYQFIIDEIGEPGIKHLERLGIHNQIDALTVCQKWEEGHSSGLPRVGAVYAKYFFKNEVGSDFDDHLKENTFLAYCLKNGKFIDFLHFAKHFFYYWRLDEGYTTSKNHGSDFFASNDASIIDIAKFFYFTKDTLPSYFYIDNHIPVLYDKVPGLIRQPVNPFEMITLDNYDNTEYIFNHNYDCYGYTLDGFYLDEEYNIEITKLTYNVISNLDTINIYVKFNKNPDETYE